MVYAAVGFSVIVFNSSPDDEITTCVETDVDPNQETAAELFLYPTWLVEVNTVVAEAFTVDRLLKYCEEIRDDALDATGLAGYEDEE